jgi:hypothetical protein
LRRGAAWGQHRFAEPELKGFQFLQAPQRLESPAAHGQRMMQAYTHFCFVPLEAMERYAALPLSNYQTASGKLAGAGVQ